jgi:hypothetical protein
MDPYKDKAILYELYVKKRLGIKEMSDIFLKNYNCKVTPQSIYNWLEKYDLLKFRGKGRNINISRGQKTGMAKKTKPPWLH